MRGGGTEKPCILPVDGGSGNVLYEVGCMHVSRLLFPGGDL